jgi:predicted Zn-dependent protease
VAKADVLARVRADLAAGHTHLAIQRLRTLLATLPEDLEVRSLLANVYRQTGNLVEAGRWGFLTDDVRQDELAAYEKANSDPWQRLRLLHFAGDPAALPDAAEERLAQLAEEAQQSGPPTQWSGGYRPPPESRSATFPCLFTAIVISAVIVLAGIGALKIVDWLAH